MRAGFRVGKEFSNKIYILWSDIIPIVFISCLTHCCSSFLLYRLMKTLPCSDAYYIGSRLADQGGEINFARDCRLMPYLQTEVRRLGCCLLD
jgi:hypothetical protein